MKISSIKIDDIAFGSSVQDITVPDVLKKRVKSGLGYFDAILGGEGFTPSAVSLFTGTPGAGKTTMMLSLANALQGHGAEVLFNTAEESLYQVKMTCDRLRIKHPFKVGGETRVPVLLEGCDKIRQAASKRPPISAAIATTSPGPERYNNVVPAIAIQAKTIIRFLRWLS